MPLGQRLRAIIAARSLPARKPELRVLDSVLLRSLRIARLRLLSTVRPLHRNESVTVVVALRDRDDWRLETLLRSLRTQTLPRERLKIIISDFGSAPSSGTHLFALTKEFDAQLVRSGVGEDWSRARAVNAALLCVGTAYTCIADCDLLFSPTFFEVALSRLGDNPLALVGGPRMDLPPTWQPSDEGFDVQSLRAVAKPRNDNPLHPSCLTLATRWLLSIDGYDEVYRVWGSEDEDLHLRLRVFGLRPVSIAPEAWYFHQWHPKYEGVDGPSLQGIILDNQRHLAAVRDLKARKSMIRARGSCVT